MSAATEHPDLRSVVPAWNEHRWSDLLAALIRTDPAPIGRLIGAEPVQVEREKAIPGDSPRTSDRLDLLLSRGNGQVAAIEVKVLSDLGLDQLDRYRAAFPDAGSYYVLHLGSLPVNVHSVAPWQSLTWEDVLAAHAASEHPWVAMTAQAWLAQLDTLIPKVDAATVWNAVPGDVAGFELALRARIAWLGHHGAPSGLGCDIVQSSGGGSWVLRLWADTSAPGLRVQVEVQEGMPAYEWGFDPARRFRDRLRGPAPLVGLRLSDVDTSADFDWGLLHRVFAAHVLDGQGSPLPQWPWQLTSASPRHRVDRAAWTAMIDAGGPKWLGKGFGMATATRHRECLFGARMQFDPSLTLAQVRDQIAALAPLIVALAETADHSANS